MAETFVGLILHEVHEFGAKMCILIFILVLVSCNLVHQNLNICDLVEAHATVQSKVVIRSVRDQFSSVTKVL